MSKLRTETVTEVHHWNDAYLASKPHVTTAYAFVMASLR